jgi:hypothetical protein
MHLWDLNKAESFLADLGAGELAELSSEHEDFVPFEVSEGLSTGLVGVGLADGALSVLLGDAFLLGDGFDLAASGSSEDFGDERSEVQSPDGDHLSLDAFAIDEDSLVAENIDNGGEFALKRTVADSGDATDLNESVIALNSWRRTICDVW